LYNLGRDEESDAALQVIIDDGSSAVYAATVYAYRGDSDKAFEWLDRAYEGHDDATVEVRMYRAFEPLYNDPRWDEYLKRIGISDADAKSAGL
jgi:hypothetical protein